MTLIQVSHKRWRFSSSFQREANLFVCMLQEEQLYEEQLHEEQLHEETVLSRSLYRLSNKASHLTAFSA